ncbi:hypothetical protein ACIGHG_12760 [Bacillus sp. NPDC077411]|uniref:hypothetical protein n=1 Tax=Bacillus sp. NPDC077411 TaxID=3363947 RepID=UPI0037C7A546
MRLAILKVGKSRNEKMYQLGGKMAEGVYNAKEYSWRNDLLTIIEECEYESK